MRTNIRCTRKISTTPRQSVATQTRRDTNTSTHTHTHNCLVSPAMLNVSAGRKRHNALISQLPRLETSSSGSRYPFPWQQSDVPAEVSFPLCTRSATLGNVLPRLASPRLPSRTSVLLRVNELCQKCCEQALEGEPRVALRGIERCHNTFQCSVLPPLPSHSLPPSS